MIEVLKAPPLNHAGPEILRYLQREGIIREFDDKEANLAWEWYTPDKYLKAIRKMMGGIDIDPASSEIAQRRVKAKVYYTRKTNGLDHEWKGNLWLNPPYKESLITQFIDKAAKEYLDGCVAQAIIQTHTATTWKKWFQKLVRLSDAMCFVNEVIQWIPSWKGYEKDLRALGFNPDEFPTYDVMPVIFFYWGKESRRFYKIFSKFGQVWRNSEHPADSLR